MISIFRNGAGYAVVYILLMLPTYVLPYFGSNSALMAVGSMATGIGLTVQWWMHVWCLLMLILICWLRGAINGRAYLPVFPFLAAVFDMVPGINLIPLIATVLHIVAIILGVMRSAAVTAPATVGDTLAEDTSLTKKSRIALGLMIALTVIAIAGSVYSISATTRGGLFKGTKPNASNNAPQQLTPPQTQVTPRPAVSPNITKIPPAEPDGSTLLRTVRGESARVYPALPREPERVVYERSADGIGESIPGFFGYIKLRNAEDAFSSPSAQSASEQGASGSVFRVKKILVTEKPRKMRVLKNIDDGCGNRFKANDIVFPMMETGEGSTFNFAFVAGENTLRRPYCLEGIGGSTEKMEPSMVSPAGKVVKGKAERPVFEVEDRQGNLLFLRSPNFQVVYGDAYAAWAPARTMSNAQSDANQTPDAGTARTQLPANTPLEVQDNGKEWLLARKPGENEPAGFVRRDRLILR